MKTPKTFGEPEAYTGATAQDNVIVHVLGFDEITRENFRVKLQAQVTLTGGKDPEGLPVGFFLNGILMGKAACDEFGVAGMVLTIDWAALQRGKALTVKVKGMAQPTPVQWDVPKSPMELEAEEHERQERIKKEEQKRQEEERQRIIAIISQNMVEISAGTFWMGTTDQDIRQFGHGACELPRHKVKLTAFAIGKYPVTQTQWQAMMGKNPSQFKGDDRPVENVSWNDAQEFLKKLNNPSQSPLIQGGQRGVFRLPSEAEWECACRAGTETIWPFGNDPAQLHEYAWFNQNSDGQTHPVGQRKPNAWGLYDMLGNVWEWCQDTYHADYNGAPINGRAWESDGFLRILRGGSWDYLSLDIRSAYRNHGIQLDQSNNTGFRVAMTL